MTDRFPTPPPLGELVSPTLPSEGARHLLSQRRSAGKMTLGDPGPSHDQLAELLTVAARVPDHRRVEPWRFITFTGEARTTFGAALAKIYRSQTPLASDEDVHKSATHLPMRAPTVIAVVSSPDPDHKTPVWEQELSTGAVCLNLLLAANAAGWAGVWLTEWISYDREVAAVMGLTAQERVAGFIYLGTSTADPPERKRPETAAKVTAWTEPATSARPFGSQ